MNHVKIFIVLSLLLAPLTLFGQAKVGTTVMPFLKVGVSARAVGIGAFTAVSDDASALYYNPAGLIQLRHPEATFSYINYPADINFVSFGGVRPLPSLSGVIGFQVVSMYTDQMDVTTVEMPYGTGRTFSSSDLAAGLSYCQRLTEKFSVGANFKFLNERLADVSAFGWSADVGTFYATGWKKINIGMVIQNFGSDIRFGDDGEPLPISFKFGTSWVALERAMYLLKISGEFVHPNDNLEVYIIGAELDIMKMVSFRMGKRVNAWKRDSWLDYQENRKNDPFVEYPVLDEDGNITLDGFSFGLGLNIVEVGVTVDYAWARLGTLGPVHRFSLGYKLAGLF
jgi:hypothetical protein